MLEAEKGERETKHVIIQYHLMDRSVGAQIEEGNRKLPDNPTANILV